MQITNKFDTGIDSTVVAVKVDQTRKNSQRSVKSQKVITKLEHELTVKQLREKFEKEQKAMASKMRQLEEENKKHQQKGNDLNLQLEQRQKQIVRLQMNERRIVGNVAVFETKER